MPNKYADKLFSIAFYALFHCSQLFFFLARDVNLLIKRGRISTLF
jgi:hypothetical protein